MEEKGWGRVRGKLPRGFKWEVQLAKRKNRKGRAMEGMVMGVRRRIETVKEDRVEVNGMMTKMIRLEGEVWRIIEVYVNGDLEEKWEILREGGRRK